MNQLSLLGDGVSTYHKLQMDMFSRLTIGSETIIDEVPFLDEGFIKTKIERLKKEHETVSREIKIAKELKIDSDRERNRIDQLHSKLEKIETKIVYLALNSFNSLELCKSIIAGKGRKVESLILALEYALKHDAKTAIDLFQKYFEINGVESGFFLPNKVYGKLLVEQGKYQEALKHLEYAIMLRVNDMELLNLLRISYEQTGKVLEMDITKEVLQILGQEVEA